MMLESDKSLRGLGDWWDAFASTFDTGATTAVDSAVNAALPSFDFNQFMNTVDVPGVTATAIDTSQWAINLDTGAAVDTMTGVTIPAADLTAAAQNGVDFGALPHIDTATLNAGLGINGGAVPSIVTNADGSVYDPISGNTYQKDGSVIAPGGGVFSPGALLDSPASAAQSASLLSQLAKAGLSLFSGYRVAALPGGGSILVPKTQVAANGRIAGGTYAGYPTSPTPVSGSLSQSLSNAFGSTGVLIPVGLGLLAILALTR